MTDDAHDVPASAYPLAWEADVILRDGSTTHVRPIRPADADALQAFHVAQSERSIYFRFFAPLPRLPEKDLVRFTHVDHVDRAALVAVAAPLGGEDTGERIIGVARYDRTGPHSAEVAFNIADSLQGRGLGSVLLEHIAAAARERGIRHFSAEVLPQNTRMLAVFREAGYDLTQRLEDEVYMVTIDLDPTERSRSVMAERERRAEARSIQTLFDVASVVVVASPTTQPGSADAQMIERAIEALVASRTLTERATDGDGPQRPRIDVVSLPPAARLWSTDEVTYHASLAALADAREGDAPDEGRGPLAVLAAPPAEAVAAVPGLARLRTHALLLFSEGFAEAGPEGLERQRALLRSARTAGMRVVGPGSYGLLRASADVTINATLATAPPPPGRIGVFCQSAPTAVTLLATLARRGLGLSSFLSAGNRADVSGNDLLQYWHEDDATHVACLYLESIGNPRKFSRIARRLAARKPVVVVTAGRSGQVVPPGHAVRPTLAPRRTLDEMLRQSGVIRAENTHEMMDLAQLLDTQPLPAGRRVGVVASSVALAALVAEAAAANGLTVLPRTGVVAESDDAAQAARVVDEVFDADCDAVVVVEIPVLGGAQRPLARAAAQAAARTGRTTVASVLGRHGLVDELAALAPDGTTVHVPAYATPEDAVRALGAVARYAAWRRDGFGTFAQPDADTDRAQTLVDTWLADATPDVDLPLAPDRVDELLACYGLTVVPVRTVGSADEAVSAADALGWPVALKSTAEALRHRADLGGVRLGITDHAELRTAYAAMAAETARLLGEAAPLDVQTMVTGGVACVVRSTEDPLFGPVVSFGLAGDATDLLADVSYGIPPLTDRDVADMVRSLRAAPRLFGYRGIGPMDVPAIEDVLARVARLADDVPELRSLELYPVVVSPHGAHVLAARAVLAHGQRPDESRRAMPG